MLTWWRAWPTLLVGVDHIVVGVVVFQTRCGSCINSIENSMSSGDIDKTLLAFLNGLSRRQYFGEDQFSDQFLREEVLGNIAVDGEVIYTLIIVNFVWVYILFFNRVYGTAEAISNYYWYNGISRHGLCSAWCFSYLSNEETSGIF